jgi:hypothetical protein
MRKWNGEGSFACIYYGFYLWKDRDKRNFKNINRALEIQNYKCCLGMGKEALHVYIMDFIYGKTVTREILRT